MEKTYGPYQNNTKSLFPPIERGKQAGEDVIDGRSGLPGGDLVDLHSGIHLAMAGAAIAVLAAATAELLRKLRRVLSVMVSPLGLRVENVLQ